MTAATGTKSLVRTLEDAGVRLTAPRREVARLIASRVGHFTAADLEADPRAHRAHIGRATIFRSLDLLSTLGVIERIDLPNGEHAYVACEPEHHHHVVCSSCGRSSDFDDADLSAVVSSVAARTGYRIDTHRLELFGLCRSCQAAEARG
jgi:Fur family transcriptional regulator, ferric uptake regulator